jgi:hypothetical protein
MIIILLLFLCLSTAVHPMAALTKAEDQILKKRGTPINSVCLIVHKNKDGKSTLSTGTLIDPNWVISAAHAVPDHNDIARSSYVTESIKKMTMNGVVHFKQGNIGNLIPTARVDYALISTHYRPFREIYLQDIALCHLTTPVHHIAPLPIIKPALWMAQKRDRHNRLKMLICGRGTNRDSRHLLYDRHAFVSDVFTNLKDINKALKIPTINKLFHQSAWHMPTFQVTDMMIPKEKSHTISPTNPWDSGLFGGNFDLTDQANPLKGDSGSGMFVEHNNQLYLAGIYTGNTKSSVTKRIAHGRLGGRPFYRKKTGGVSFGRIEPIVLPPTGELLPWIIKLFSEAQLTTILGDQYVPTPINPSTTVRKVKKKISTE